MAWRFRKRIKVIPGVYLNLSKSGISTTIGPKGLSLNIGQGGSFLNTGIPGTGLYNRILLSGNSNSQVDATKADEIAERLKHLLERTNDGSEQIMSESIEQLTSPGLAGLKTAILTAHKEYEDISKDISDRNNQKEKLDKKLNKLQQSIFKFLFKKRIQRLSGESTLLTDELQELNKQLNLSSVELTINNDETFNSLHRNVEQSYQLLANCDKIWDITTTKDVNKIHERSLADAFINRVEAKAKIEESGLIISKSVPLKLCNKNGGDLYFYPGFIIIHEQLLDFAILDYSELDLEFVTMHFVETEAIPKDTEIVGQTWVKVNKDGSPDRRFKDNYQIPLTKYGKLTLTSTTGLKEGFLFSNHKYSNLFFTALEEYINAIKTANLLLKEFK